MFSSKLDQRRPSVVFHWFLLSFNGGFINAGGFLSTGKFVSHVTGFGTLVGVDAANRHIWSSLSLLTVPMLFMFGAFLAGLLVERPLELGKRPHFDWVMFASSLCLFICATNVFGFHEFGATLSTFHSFIVLALLCSACGLQNGAVTLYSAQSIRTTHLTGITTDLGLGLAKVCVLKPKTERYRKEIYSNQLRLGSIVSFIFGSAIGAITFLKFGYPGFYIPSAISFYAALRAAKQSRAIS